jgi:hypothetical protein
MLLPLLMALLPPLLPLLLPALHILFLQFLLLHAFYGQCPVLLSATQPNCMSIL